MPSFPSPSLEGGRNGMEAVEAKRGGSLLLSVLPVGRPRSSRRNCHLSTGPGLLLAHPCAWPRACQGNLAVQHAPDWGCSRSARQCRLALGSLGAVTCCFVPQQGAGCQGG